MITTTKLLLTIIILSIQLTIIYSKGFRKSEKSQEKGKFYMPKIGILTQDFHITFRKNDWSNSTDYFRDAKQLIPSSYVQFIQQSGGKVVPVRTDQPIENILEIVGKLDGVLFPGGGVPLVENGDQVTDFLKIEEQIMDYIIEQNDKGNYYPIFTTCLGFESMLRKFVCEEYYSKGEQCPLFSFNGNITDAEYRSELIFHQKGMERSKIYNFNNKEIRESTLDVIKTKKTAFYHHVYFMKVKNFFRIKKVHENFHLILSNIRPDGNEVVSMIEAKHYPFVGTQFHPEKQAYENYITPNEYDHYYEGIVFMRYMSDKFVNECRKGNDKGEIPIEWYLQAQNIQQYKLLEVYDRAYLFY